MKKIGIIPARYASTRFPGKPLVDILGKTMIERVYQRAIKSDVLDEVYVATDDNRICHVLESKNIPYILTDSKTPTGTERCLEAAKTLNLSDKDILINIQGDEPFIHGEQIALVVQAFDSDDVQISTLRKKIERIAPVLNPNSVKVVTNKENNALYFSRSPIPYLRNYPQDQWLEHAEFYKHIGIYGFRFSALKTICSLPKSPIENHESLEQLSWLWHGFDIKVLETMVESPSIDTPKDLEKILTNYRLYINSGEA
jgi:3-deoxy-manno-octulosonate cytidylyltransferase (CMP-KDO synthetase)